MPSIIPSPGEPGVEPNLAASMPVSGDIHVAAGSTIYTRSAYFIYDGGSGMYHDFVNDGALWNVQDGQYSRAGVLRSYHLDRFVNNGLIVAWADAGDAITFNEALAQTRFVNTGRIFALARDHATAIIDSTASGSSLPYYAIENEGLIAARGGLGAIAIVRNFPGGLINGATGSILAEGDQAIAVRMSTVSISFVVPMSIANEGRIEAVSTDVSVPSIAIQLFTGRLDAPVIANSGNIRGDIAVLIEDGIGDAPRKSAETLINEQSGTITGDIDLGRGDDVIVNRGRIQGDVDLFEGDDRFDNQAGLLVGVADLGWGADSFLGGAGTDAVRGDRGDDRIVGGGGNDLLLGGRGDDVIEGGVGADGLYGEAGNDLIRAGLGDRVVAGDGNDRVEVADYAFFRVDGGAGIDTLVFQADRLLDLRSVMMGGRVSGFERVALAGGQEVVIRVADVAAFGSDNELVIEASALAKVDLLGGWAETGSRTIDGTLYRIFGADGARVLVQSGAAVGVIAVAPTDSLGLDFYGSVEAPLAGSIPGATLSPSLTEVGNFLLNSALTIDADETWRSATGAPVILFSDYGDPSPVFVNRGTVESIGGVNGARALELGSITSIENSGTISATGIGISDYLQSRKATLAGFGPNVYYDYNQDYTLALQAGSAPVTNSGSILAQSTYSFATAVSGFALENHGIISAKSVHFAAVGAGVAWSHLVNHGTISAEGGYAAYAVSAYAPEPTLVSNYGLIEATAGAGGLAAVGVYFSRGSGNPAPGYGVLENAGIIRAEIGVQSETTTGNGVWIRNSGEIHGRIDLDTRLGQAGNDVVENDGLIVGDVSLGAGNDIYIATGGRQQGDVKGGAGFDELVGTAMADRLFGEDGSDLLSGGLGADRLSGGGQSDTFIYRSVADSTTDATDTITDFQTGLDRIDLTALTVTDLTLTAGAGYTLLQAATAAGTLTIRVEGSILASDVIVANVAARTGTTGDDLLIATAGGTILSGGFGADMLLGQAGADRLDGGWGADIMWGGAGDDYYVVDDMRDIVVELAGDGVDTLEYQNLPRYVLPDHVENGVSRIGQLVGNALANVMSGDQYGNYLDGGVGADTLIGGSGGDYYVIDDAGDRIVETGDEFDVDSVTSSIDFVLADNLENLTLSGAATNGTGNARQNQMTGAGLNDTLIAGAGDDRLDGMDGDDRLYGEEGGDRLLGRAGSDRLFGGAGDDEIQGGDHDDWIEGGDGDDLIYADDPPTMYDPGPLAGIGTDVIIGGAGADDIRLGLGADRVVYLAAADSTAVARDTISAFQTGEDKIDLVALGPLSLSWTEENDGGIIFRNVTATGAGGTLSLRVASSMARSDFIYQDAGMSLAGTGSNDDIEGWNGNDTLFFQQGGDDRVRGYEGNDGFYFGAALTGLDSVDGGTGTDTLAIQGNYSALTLAGVSNVEVLFVAPGSDTRFGDTAGNSYDYAIASVDANVAAGATLTVQASELRTGEDLSFDGAAETNGRFRIFAGRGSDTLVGGAGSDGFFFGADGNLTSADRINGGGGTDSIALRGNYTGARAVLFEDASFANVEVLTLLSGHSNEFGGVIDTNGFDYDLTLADGNLAAGARLDVIASNLRANESARIDARAELDGTVRILAGAGDDALFGGGGNDILYGGLGADSLAGSAGSDVYQYRAVAESTAAARDALVFGSGDKIDLSLIDAVAGSAANEAFAFIGDAAFSNAAGQLRAYQSGLGWLVEGDVNGDGLADLMIAVASDLPIVASDFVL